MGSGAGTNRARGIPRLLLLVLILPIVVFGGFFGIVIAASELAGEVVTVRTVGTDGSTKATRLWIVDDAGVSWLRAGVPSETWLMHVDRNPMITLERGGSPRAMRAIPVRDDPAVRDRVHALMQERYRGVDTFISMLRDGARSVPVRLDPAP